MVSNSDKRSLFLLDWLRSTIVSLDDGILRQLVGRSGIVGMWANGRAIGLERRDGGVVTIDNVRTELVLEVIIAELEGVH